VACAYVHDRPSLTFSQATAEPQDGLASRATAAVRCRRLVFLGRQIEVLRPSAFEWQPTSEDRRERTANRPGRSIPAVTFALERFA